MSYEEPVARLLKIGDDGTFPITGHTTWPDYAEQYGLTTEHIPQLIAMMTDGELLNIEGDVPEYYATTHAMRALAMLNAQEAVEPIIRLFHEGDSNELLWEYFPEAISRLGPSHIPALKTYLNDDTHDESSRGHAASCLFRMAKDHPDHAGTCVDILVEQLKDYDANGYTLNTEIISVLAWLKAEHALPLIREAYEADAVEAGFIDYPDVLQIMNQTSDLKATAPKADPKKKKKRKTSKTSRKRNRKR